MTAKAIRYWNCFNDGAKWRCKHCDQLASYTEIVLVEHGDGVRGAYHRHCIDLTSATDMGDWNK